MITAEVDAEEFARALGNAMAFCPSKTQWKGPAQVAMNFEVDAIEIIGTDTYTFGRDFVPTVDCDGEGSAFFSAPAKAGEGVLSLIKAAKEISGTIKVRLTEGDCVQIGETAAQVTTWDEGLWSNIAILLERFSKGDFEPVTPVAFDATKLARFAKVKVDGDPILDLWFQGDELPVLGKMGDRFVGGIMPIKRDYHEDDDLWTSD